jgi:hypothetical protein
MLRSGFSAEFFYARFQIRPARHDGITASAVVARLSHTRSELMLARWPIVTQGMTILTLCFVGLSAEMPGRRDRILIVQHG